jgi:hypothetical protein
MVFLQEYRAKNKAQFVGKSSKEVVKAAAAIYKASK